MLKNYLRQMALQAGVNAVSRAMKPDHSPAPSDPMDGWATLEDLAQYEYDPRSVYFGNIHADHGAVFEAGLPLNDDRHLFIVAGNGAGKGTSFLVQNCIRWQGGIVVIDPKGEAAGITAMRRGTRENALKTGTSVRQFIGQEVAILDPFNIVQGAAKKYRRRYNPLADVNINQAGWSRQIKRIARMAISQDSGGGAGEHFSESIMIVLMGVIEKLLFTAKGRAPSFVDCDKVLWKPFQERDDHGEEITGSGLLGWMQDAPETSVNFARKSATTMQEIGGEEWGSVRTTLARKMSWLADEELRQHMSKSDVSITKLIQNGGSLYIVVDPDTMADVAEWMRIVVRQAISAKIALGDKQTGLQTFFMLDEFPLLGHFDVIEKSAGYMRGYGVKLMPIIQNIGQVKKHYAQNWETFLGNAGAIVAWATNDGETEKYLSERYGHKWAWEEGFSQSDNVGVDGGGNWSRSMAKHQRPLLLPNEIHTLGARETGRAFILPAAGKPFMIERQPYFTALEGKGLFDSPQFIREWESKYAR